MSTQTHTLSLSSESSDQLSALAQQMDTSVTELLQETVERWLAWEREALAAHHEGLRQIQAGRSYSSEEVRAKLDTVIQAGRAA